MNIHDAFPSKYLRAEQIGQATPVVVIDRIEVQPDLEGRPALYFVGKSAAMALNKTNATALADMFGPDTEKWAGQRVQLYTELTTFAGKSVLGLRVRRAPAAPSVPGSSPPTESVPPPTGTQ